MGHGYEWASMLKISAFFGMGMSALMLMLAIFIYYRRRHIGAIVFVATTLFVILLLGSSYLLYQATQSKERLTLNQVDLQIMHVVDIHQRVKFLLRNAPVIKGNDEEKINYTLGLARDYLGEIEQSITEIQGLKFLNRVFQVENKENLTKSASLAYIFAGGLGLVLTLIIAFLTSVYLVLRCYLDPTSTRSVGWLITAAVFIAFAFFTSHDKHGSFNPMIVTLLLVAAIVAYFHVCIHFFPKLVLEISGCVIVVLCAVSLVFSSWAIILHGEDKLLAKLKVMNASTPMIVSRAQMLATSLDEFLAVNDFSEGWDEGLIGSTISIGIAIGALEENLENSDPQSDDPAEWRIYNPYKDEFETFEREYRKRLDLPIE